MAKPDKIVLLDIDDTLFDTDAFIKSGRTQFRIFEEVRDALSDLSKVATLGILSQGEIAFQKKKLIETNIQEYFQEEHIHIVEVKVDYFKELVKIYADKGELFVVEDRLDTLHVAKKIYPNIVAVWMKRGRYAHFQKPIPGFTPDAVVMSLKEVVQLLKNRV